jgi:hypothetical protein
MKNRMFLGSAIFVVVVAATVGLALMLLSPAPIPPKPSGLPYQGPELSQSRDLRLPAASSAKRGETLSMANGETPSK